MGNKKGGGRRAREGHRVIYLLLLQPSISLRGAACSMLKAGTTVKGRWNGGGEGWWGGGGGGGERAACSMSCSTPC